MVNLLTRRNLLSLIIVLVTIWMAVEALRNFLTLGPDISRELIPKNIDLTLKNITYTKTRNGVPLWTLRADSALHSNETNSTQVKNVRVVFFDKETGNIKLTADRGALLPEQHAVTVSSNVVVVNPQGSTLRTDYLRYEEDSNILHTDRIVTITGDNFTVRGRGMQIDVIARTLVLLSDVKAQSAMDTDGQ
jgi:LPS export ABC transporter protein LptC